jgi:hypothetical protein
MIPLKVESVARESCPADLRSEMVDEFALRKGDFVAVVQPNGSRYEFFVRDLRREGPTIQGFGVDFSNAVSAVTQLLDALTRDR